MDGGLRRSGRLAPCLLLLGALAAAGSGACAAGRTGAPPSRMPPEEPWAPPRRLEPAATLPGQVRQILRQRMASHARDMTELVWATVLLDHERAGELGGRIAHDVDIARPLTHDATELNAQIPVRFFDLQDQLRTRAREVALAASRRDAAALSRAYGALAETCVGCHSVYRDGPAVSARSAGARP